MFTDEGFGQQMLQLLQDIAAAKLCTSADGLDEIFKLILKEIDDIEEKIFKGDTLHSVMDCGLTIMSAIDALRDGGYKYAIEIKMLAGQYIMQVQCLPMLHTDVDWELPGIKNISNENMTKTRKEWREDLIALVTHLRADIPNYIEGLQKDEFSPTTSCLFSNEFGRRPFGR